MPQNCPKPLVKVDWVEIENWDGAEVDVPYHRPTDSSTASPG